MKLPKWFSQISVPATSAAAREDDLALARVEAEIVEAAGEVARLEHQCRLAGESTDPPPAGVRPNNRHQDAPGFAKQLERARACQARLDAQRAALKAAIAQRPAQEAARREVIARAWPQYEAQLRRVYGQALALQHEHANLRLLGDELREATGHACIAGVVTCGLDGSGLLALSADRGPVSFETAVGTGQTTSILKRFAAFATAQGFDLDAA